MDTDFLVVKDLDEILNLTKSYDLVSYVDEGGGSLEKGHSTHQSVERLQMLQFFWLLRSVFQTLQLQFYGLQKGQQLHESCLEQAKVPGRNNLNVSLKMKSRRFDSDTNII